MHKLGQLLPADRTGLRLLDAVIGSDGVGIFVQPGTDLCGRKIIFFILHEYKAHFLFALITVIPILADVAQSLEFFAAHRANLCFY